MIIIYDMAAQESYKYPETKTGKTAAGKKLNQLSKLNSGKNVRVVFGAPEVKK